MTTATKRTAAAQDVRVRSVALAEARGHTICSWAARTIGMALDEQGALISATWRIASASSDAEYIVGYLALTDETTCECRAAQFERPCWHAGLGLLKGRYLARLYSAKGRAAAEREYARDLAGEENARCLGF